MLAWLVFYLLLLALQCTLQFGTRTGVSCYSREQLWQLRQMKTSKPQVLNYYCPADLTSVVMKNLQKIDHVLSEAQNKLTLL